MNKKLLILEKVLNQEKIIFLLLEEQKKETNYEKSVSIEYNLMKERLILSKLKGKYKGNKHGH